MTGVWRPMLPRRRGASTPAVEGFAILTLIFRNEGKGTWTGECRELGTATDGSDLDQVHAELVDLAILHLNALEQTGERERFFEKPPYPVLPSGRHPLADSGPVAGR